MKQKPTALAGLHELINTGAITFEGSRKPAMIIGTLVILAAFAYAFVAGGVA